MKKTHIIFLLLNKYSGRGGTERALINIVNGLYNLRVSSSIVFMEKPDYLDFTREFPDETDVLTYEKKDDITGFLFAKYKYQNNLKNNIARLRVKHGLDAIIVLDFSKNLIRSFNTLEFFKKKYGCSIIGWPHIFLSDMEKNEYDQLKRSVGLFDAVFAVSLGMKDNISQIYSRKKIKVVGNPVKKSKILPREGNSFLFLGRIDDPNKNFLSLLYSLSLLKGNWVLNVYGGIEDLKLKLRIENECLQLGLLKNIFFHGWKDKPWDNIQSGGVLLLNSKQETFGLVLVEAMMRGIPCISIDCPTGPREIIVDDVNGWLVGSNKGNTMSQIMQSIIDGEIILPDSIEIQKSVKSYELESVAQKFNEYLTMEIDIRPNT